MTTKLAYGRRGSALVISLVLLTVISAAVAGTFSMIASERQTLGDQEGESEAYDIARSALDRFLADPAGTWPAFNPPLWAGPDSIRINFSNGHAWVRVQRLQLTGNSQVALYSVRSRGVRTTYRSGNTPAAERVVAQYARYNTGTLPALGAWTSLAGLQKTGTSGVITGNDGCAVLPPVAGVAVPTTPGYMQNGGALVPTGNPNILDMGSQAQANDMVGIDWAGIVNGTALPFDVVSPPAAWPNFANPNYWPIIYVDQIAEFTPPSDGRGLLIVRRDMRLNGSLRWDGIVLVGGALTSSGNNTVQGAVVTGLNLILGEAAAVSDLGNGSKTFQYNSCNIANAANRLRGLTPLRNTTVDNWPLY
ncbi:MAG TPA: hypothetical protein VJ717_15515 [Gemmatimonadaceae bacterium]|nr:hypothetical protein [Gemmatimonadaceae bacterium]